MSDVTTSAKTVGSETEADPKRWSILAVVVVAQLMVVLDASIVTIALPSAQKALGISVANRQWVITAYTLAFGGLLLLGGRIADFGGRKRVFIMGLIGFAAASALGGFAANQAMLFGAWALQGAFAAVMAPAALSNSDHYLPRRSEGAGKGIRSLRSGFRRRRSNRCPRRRHSHRVRLMAMVPSGECAGRAPCRRGGIASGS